MQITNPHLWNLDDPYLYEIRSTIYGLERNKSHHSAVQQNELHQKDVQKSEVERGDLQQKGVHPNEAQYPSSDDEAVDQLLVRVGIRSAEFHSDGKFYLNGKPLKLRGLNRHQMYPYLGGAMCDRGQRKDADMLKVDLGLHFVRSSHYPADPSFLDRCDEIGLLVFEELPGWQFIGDDAWKTISLQHVEEMIVRDRNHPSIFLWGVRINESQDDHEFYKTNNEHARSLDPSRATGGVRAFRSSEFLEDVFTYNDFTRNREGEVLLPNHVPYLITEYMGHMYPTKAYDSVERQIKHALGHAAIQNGQYGVPQIAGAAGWCAFDYNTHQDFGSGDRICYHGVCDIFRLPKFAAHFYRSQQEPHISPVVFIARYLVPSFNEDFKDAVPVFTNCEEADLYVNGTKVATERPDYMHYPNLPHPPVVFTGCSWWEWGASLVSSLKVVGKIGGIAVAEHEISPFGLPSRLSLTSDVEELIADGADCTRVVVELKDSHNQTLHLAHHPVDFRLEGEGRLIGENPFSLEAGRGAVYVQASRVPGTIRLVASVKGVGEAVIQVQTTALQEKIVPTRL
ncbi:Beta-galactosidase [compost metagenome]